MCNISARSAFVLIALIYCCSYGVDGREKVYQNLHADFINSETNNKKPTPQPTLLNLPNQPNQPNQPLEPNKPVGIATGTNVRPTPTSNVRDLINKFNEQGTNSNVQNPTSTTKVNLPTPVTPKNVLRPNPPPRENFPALPSSVTTPKPTQANAFSYSSVVSGKKQLVPVPENRPNPQTVTVKPSVGLPVTQKQLIPIPVDSKPTAAPELISDNELKDISESLFRKDNNNPLKHITINYQGTTTSQSKNDVAPQPLIAVTPNLWTVPTIAAMKTLLDNYEQDAAVNEYVTPQEKNEENAFLDLIMATPVMRQLMTSLKDKGLVSPDPKLQRDIIKQIWFNLYSRGQGKIGSSGFEHIFLSEIKNREISGLHNWVYFHLEEEAKRANYLGYMKKVTFGNKGGIVKFHFNLKGIDKPVDSMFIGTTPELEMALYSLCFITRADKYCPLWLDGQKFGIRTHTFRYRSKNMIGSAFPEI